MVQFVTVLSSAVLAGLAIAQTPNASFNSSVFSQVAGELSAGDRASYCNAQYRACNVLCVKATANTCDVTSLNYTCTCAGNNSSPMFQYYNPTMLTNVCNQYLGDCLKATAGFADQQDNCKATIVCGNSSIDAFASSPAGQSQAASSSSASASATSGTTSSTASPSPTKNAATLIDIGASYGTGIFGVLVLGVFGIAL